jgi:hypothetical protein
MAMAILDPNEGHRQPGEIYAEIAQLMLAGDIGSWDEDQYLRAKELLDEWLELPDGTPEDEEVAPIDPRAEWLWDQLEPIEGHQTEAEEAEPDPFLVEVDVWARAVKEILIEGWQQFDRFEFRCEDSGRGSDGDLAARASHLWMQYDLLERNDKHQQFLELFTLWSELESHIDPDGEIHGIRVQIRNRKRAEELKQEGRHEAAEKWLTPKQQWERPKECSKESWAKIIKPFDRCGFNEPVEEFLARVELARNGYLGAKGMTFVEALKDFQEDPHTKIRELIEGGSSWLQVQELINRQSRTYNPSGLKQYAEHYLEENERRQDLADALENLLLRGMPPEIKLADYVPAEWMPMFRVLREGLQFSDEAIVMTIAAGVAAMFPPPVRIKGWSMEEVPTIWIFHIGTSGTAKSVLLRKLINGPMAKPLAAIDAVNKRDKEAHERAREDGESVPPFRKRNLIYTSPTTQGIRADLAIHGPEVPGLLVRDELNGWLKQMADDKGAGVADVEFWLSSYDAVYSNDVFADANRSREVRQGKLGVIGGIQPKVFLEQLNNGNANGFNSRPLFVHLPRPKRVLTRDDSETMELENKLGQLYLDALEFEFERFVLSKEAEQLFEGLFNQLEDLSIAAGSEEVEALWAKGPGQALRMAAAVHFIRVATGQEEGITSKSFITESLVVSAKSLQLAANLVMAGKTRAVALHERAANPMLDRADRLLEAVRRRQPKTASKGVLLSEVRKCWESSSRPSLVELKQIAAMLESQGLVQLRDGGKAIRVVN